jgi:hypothetical protein
MEADKPLSDKDLQELGSVIPAEAGIQASLTTKHTKCPKNDENAEDARGFSPLLPAA